MYPTKHHVRNTAGFILPSSSKTLATILQQQGWDTAAVVSSDVLKKLFGFNQGFAVYDDQMPRPGNQQKFLEDPERNAGDTIDRTLGWLNTQSGKPFFLWVHLYDPHMPYRPPPSFGEKYKERPYDREIAYADQELGRLFDAIHRKSAQTLIAVLSDHGESLGEHGEYSHGIFLYDATLRIAFMMSGPGIPAGLRVRDQARTIDFLPTILELMGGKASAEVQGASLLPSLARKDVPTAVSYGETLYPKINMGWAELRAIRTNRWKCIRAPKPELYDLSGAARVYRLTGQGVDPKDRVGILKLLAVADDPDSRMVDARRIELLRHAVREDPTNPDLYFQLATAYLERGRIPDAKRVFRWVVIADPTRAAAYNGLGLIAIQRQDSATARGYFEKAAELRPEPHGRAIESRTYL